jgi:hypothetical protein
MPFAATAVLHESWASDQREWPRPHRLRFLPTERPQTHCPPIVQRGGFSRDHCLKFDGWIDSLFGLSRVHGMQIIVDVTPPAFR